MRTRMILVAGLVLAVGLTGCAKNDDGEPSVATAQSGGTTANPSASASEDPDAPLKYAKCMRENGMTWFPDPPAPGQPQTVNVPDTVERADLQKAEEACREWAPTRDKGSGPPAADLEKIRQMAKCMRENGVPDFPDPSADGSMMLDADKLSVKPDSAAFKAAEEACKKYMPEGSKKQTAGDSGVQGGGS
ncbi:hypothetical protein [Actinoplanes sp. NPDC051851]|uniref:hypothetical protein n=1 Tax=Actinoplanes sp. NPDC051851 TaxID=3154753 RepID=UPI0034140DE4